MQIAANEFRLTLKPKNKLDIIILYAILCINNTTDNTTLNLRFKIAEVMQKIFLQTSVPKTTLLTDPKYEKILPKFCTRRIQYNQ